MDTIGQSIIFEWYNNNVYRLLLYYETIFEQGLSVIVHGNLNISQVCEILDRVRCSRDVRACDEWYQLRIENNDSRIRFAPRKRIVS